MSKTIRNDEMSLKELIEQLNDWVKYLFSKWRLIILSGIVGATLGFLYSYTQKPVYKATLSFALEDEKSGGGGLGGALGLASSFGLDLGGSGGGIFTGPNLNELFKSRSMVEKTLLSPVRIDDKVISLAEMYIQNNNWRKKWKDNPHLSSIQFLPDANRKNYTRAQDSILGEIYDNLSKKTLEIGLKDKKASIININVSSTNEMFAKYLCDALATEVSEFYIETKSKKARINMKILERQVDSVRGELNSSITSVAVANDNTFNLNPAMNIRRTPSSRRQVDVQANTAILTELVKQSEMAKVSLRKETPLIQIIDKPILPLPKEKFGKLKGLILGGFLAFFLTVVFLLMKKFLKSLD